MKLIMMNNMRIKLLLLSLLVASTLAAANRGFAIFVDSASNSRVAPELAEYAKAVSRQGLKTEIIVVSDNVLPDSIRATVRRLATRKQNPIEGFVLVGDIPIPMIRDAQHMTSAFKAVQSTKRMEGTSVPSDRYYDDLNLTFDFISRDARKPLLYYYSLRYDSPQRLEPQLYSGRIKSMDFYGKDKYANLRDYLRKLVKVKARGEKLDNMLYFSGSGYNSESILARVDEKVAHLEQFPWFKKSQQSLRFLDHRNAVFMKYPLMASMQQPDLSLALLHHHGAPQKEYINRYPDTRSVNEQLEGAKSFFRSKIRNAIADGVNPDTAKARYARDYDVPVDWFDSVMDSASIAADSIYNEQLDLHIYDLGKYKPNARLTILDACFNGAFNNDQYMAGAYIFGDGDCVAVVANSVNSIQDKIPDKNIGMLGLGMRAGNLVKYNPYLESHVIGDPTFAFSPIDKLGFDVNEALHGNASFWRKQLKSEYPAMQAMAVQKLAQLNAMTPAQLLDTYRESDSFLTRLSAFMELSETQSPEFETAIGLGLNDSYELIRRFAAIFTGKNGSPRLVKPVIANYADAATGKRVDFQLQSSMKLLPYDALMDELKAQRPYRYDTNEQEMIAKAQKEFGSRLSDRNYQEQLKELKSEKPDMRNVKLFVRQTRNNPLHPAVDELFDYLYRTDNEEIRQTLIEAFGWYGYSYRAREIADKMDKIAADPSFSEASRHEAVKTATRLRK